MIDQIPQISLVGNPNSGKSTIFNLLTGKNQKTGNWSGVTIDKKSGFFEKEHKKYQLIDLPGIYSLDSAISKSEDEKITRKNIIENQSKIFINIIDASNLEKSLFLTTELIDLEQPMILVLNKIDLAKKNNIFIDTQRLSGILGLKIIKMDAQNEQNIVELKNAITDICQQKDLAIRKVEFNQKITQSIDVLSKKKDLNRWQILEYLKNFEVNLDSKSNFTIDEIKVIQHNSGQKIDFNLINDRYKFINKILISILRKDSIFKKTYRDLTSED